MNEMFENKLKKCNTKIHILNKFQSAKYLIIHTNNKLGFISLS